MNSTSKISLFLITFSACLFFYFLLPAVHNFFDPGGQWKLWPAISEHATTDFIVFLVLATLISLGLIALMDRLAQWRRFRKIGEILVSLNFISEENLQTALARQRLEVGEILVLAGRISPQQRDLALELQKIENRMIGEILREQGAISEEDLRWALNERHKPIGRILKEMNLISDYDIDCALMLRKRGSLDKNGRIVDMK